MIRAKLCALSIVLVLSAFITPESVGAELNLSDDGIAVRGFDPVAYFTEGKPIKGSNAHVVRHDGAEYRFSTAENRQLFAADPQHYLPAYGGWCSYGVRVGKKFNIDPQAWEIVNNRLYLLLDLGTKKVWEKERMKNIEIADRLWPKIQKVLPAALDN